MLFNKLKFIKHITTTSIFIFFSISSMIIAAPTTTYHDPTIIFTPRGLNRFSENLSPKKISLRKPTFSITPYYQSASGARDKDGVKVPLGDRLGQWNMMALFYGFDASPAEKKFDLRGQRLAYPVTALNKGVLDLTPVTNGDYPGALETSKTNYPNLFNAFQTIFNQDANTAVVDNSLVINRPNVQLLAGINADKALLATEGIMSVPIKFEKIGARTEFIVNLTQQLSLIVQSGIAHYKQSPIAFIDQTPTNTNIQLTLTTTSALNLIASELGVSLNRISNTGFEDTNIKFAYTKECPFNDEENNTVVTICPWLALGGWIPTAKKRNQDNPFSLALGNDGFFGLSLEGALNFDFPQLLTLGFGGGVSIFQKQTLFNQRVPSDLRQSGFFPWKTNLKKRLGTAWNFNASLQARNFIENLSFYADFTFAKKERDEIELTDSSKTPHVPYALQVSKKFTAGEGAPSATDFSPSGIPTQLEPGSTNTPISIQKQSLFFPQKLEEESEWNAQTLNCGLMYELTKDLLLGFGFTTHFAGLRVYKTHTIMGSINLTF